MPYVFKSIKFVLFAVFLFSSCERKAGDSSTKIKFTIPIASQKSEVDSKSDSLEQSVSSSSFSGPSASTVSDISCFYVLVSGPESSFSTNSCEIYQGTNVLKNNFGIVHGGVLRGSTIELSVPSGNDREVTLIGFNSSEAGYCPPVSNVDKTKLSNPYVLGKSGPIRLEPGATQEIPIKLALDQSYYIKDCSGPDFGNQIGGENQEGNQEPDQIAAYSQISNNHFTQNYCIPFNIELRKSGKMVKTATAKLLSIQKQSTVPLSVLTVFGTTPSPGLSDGTGTAAAFNNPMSMGYDSSGNAYVADTGNHVIRKITPTGSVSVFAGSSLGMVNSTGTSAKFYSPQGLVVDAVNNVIYVADTGNHTIRKIYIATALVTTLAGGGSSSLFGTTDGTGTAARFNQPSSVVLDPNGNIIVSDTFNNRIRKVTIAGVVTTVAGSTSGFTNATGSSAQFNYPMGLAVNPNGDIYVADKGNNSIRVVNSGGTVSTLTGSGSSGSNNGALSSATFSYPQGVLFISSVATLFVSDSYNHTIRKVDLTAGIVSTYAGTSGSSGSVDGAATVASFAFPSGLMSSPTGDLMVMDSGNHGIRRVGTSSDTNNMHFYNSWAECNSGVSEVAQYSFAVGDGRKTAFVKPTSLVNASEMFSIVDTGGGLAGSSPISYSIKQIPPGYASSIVTTANTTLVFDNFYCHEVVVYGHLGSVYQTSTKIGSGGTLITPSISGSDASRIFLTSDCGSKTPVSSFNIPYGEFFTKVGIWTNSLDGRFSATVDLSPSGAVTGTPIRFNVQNYQTAM